MGTRDKDGQLLLGDYTGGSRTDKQWKEPASLVRVDA